MSDARTAPPPPTAPAPAGAPRSGPPRSVPPPTGPSRSAPSLRRLWLYFGGAAAASLLSVGGRFDLPLAAWAAPLLLLRFQRDTRPRVALPAVFAVTVASALLWMVQLAV
ncbi:hypothetical protein AB0C60_29105, partial [Streptomyces sp. NPDC048845]